MSVNPLCAYVFFYRLSNVEKQASLVTDGKAQLAAQLQAKEAALTKAMNRKADYNPKEVEDLQNQV